ncbi:MAG: Gx transporter family protein [Clostridiaceae bacterium]
MKTKRLLLLSLFSAQACILFIIESLIPIPFIAPGAKLGLANIIILFCLYTYGLKDSLIVLFMKIFITTIFVGSMSTFIYSFSGGLLSLILMYIFKTLGNKNISIIGVSIIGALSHSIGQIIIASIIINNINILYYLPYLLMSSLATGFLIGLIDKHLILSLNKLYILK